MAKKTGTMTKVGNTIKDAAATVAQAAEDYVVKPVGKAVELIKPTKTTSGRTLTGNVAKALSKSGAKRSAKKGPGPKPHKRHANPVSKSRRPKR